jgi:hypothetical protein
MLTRPSLAAVAKEDVLSLGEAPAFALDLF